MENIDPTEQLNLKFGEATFIRQVTKDELITLWVPLDRIVEVLKFLKSEIRHPFPFLFDLTAIDERSRKKDIDYPASHFSIVYHLFSFARNSFVRIKVALGRDYPTVPSISALWANANWYEREVYDMFGIRFDGHPDLRRILMWEDYKEGFPLRKDFPLRGRFSRSEQLKQALTANPEARYSMEELTIADAYGDVPEDMRRRLSGGGEKVGE